ncbi:MAG: hypothetical protein QF689_17710 [Candidatus Latescibacteria bacterium]|jgi:Na+-transporting methylmalonyl-CoA/oxaloacetate decarboxylase gamma subunit|nr:hypothetical protein [Gemmatimonadaceae bacterium]MDP6018085.1 hypothetical protein [Candidatus Latescibacterota bacterium]MDP7450431.1 hypothetical protein [Candidatus Latescibacterota bacterium]HJP33823.1 hypothetical protein [Candidatus Latescibacterota bacterium]|tara:strand:+ start:175 stop:393 length:219 start_codon:yes stop_codon:yes gene_type:complete
MVIIFFILLCVVVMLVVGFSAHFARKVDEPKTVLEAREAQVAVDEAVKELEAAERRVTDAKAQLEATNEVRG